jgi:hypothetical protein
MQNFGWSYCTIQSVKLTNPEFDESITNYVYIASPTDSIWLKFSVASTYDLDFPKLHNEFCSVGIQSEKDSMYFGTTNGLK